METSSSSYEQALDALMGVVHQAQTPQEVKAASQRRTQTIADMHEYWRRIHDGRPQQPPQMSVRRIIHVAGTKGKGSTSIMCEAICRHRYGMNTGLFTSPHLMDIRERIRINGLPVNKKVFAQAYWHVRRRLEAAATRNDYDPTLPVLPGYFRMLTLLGLYIFSHHVEPTLDVIILEVGMGGRYDATNILPMTDYQSVAGVTLLDFDHVRVLGHRIEEIAWEKGGVFQVIKGEAGQSSLRPFTVGWKLDKEDKPLRDETESSRTFYSLETNSEAAIRVLQTCAKVEGRGAKLVLVGSKHPTYGIPQHITLGLAGRHQRENAAIAVALTTELHQKCGGATTFPDLGTAAMYQGLSQVSWPARCQTVIHNEHTTFRLDGAHTVQSVQAGLEWFRGVQCDADKRPAVLFFNCSHERNPVELIAPLIETAFQRVFFCKSDSTRPSMVAKTGAREYLQETRISISEELLPTAPETWQQTLMSIWKHMDLTHSVPTFCDLSAADAVDSLGEEPVEVFVTGSLYLVGSVLSVIGWGEEEAQGNLKT